jgi:hypothetical protein
MMNQAKDAAAEENPSRHFPGAIRLSFRPFPAPFSFRKKTVKLPSLQNSNLPN